jgi:hypothetical protein
MLRDAVFKPRTSAIQFHQSLAPSHVLRRDREINPARHLHLFVSAMAMCEPRLTII